MRKKLVVLIIIFVSIIFFKSMLETNDKAAEKISITPYSVPSRINDLPDIKNEPIANETDVMEFQDELNRHYKNLPTLGDLKNLTAEEVHHTPEIITEGGGILGRVLDEAEKDPKKRLEAMSFFKKCAVDQEIATSIRAMCLNKTLNLVPQWKIPMAVTDEEISKEVFELAMKLPR